MYYSLFISYVSLWKQRKNMATITKKKRMETIDKLIGNKTLPFHLTLPCPDLSCLDIKVTGWPDPKLGSYLATMD